MSAGAACGRASTWANTREASSRDRGSYERPAASPDVAAHERTAAPASTSCGGTRRNRPPRRECGRDPARPRPRAPAGAASTFDVGAARRAFARARGGKHGRRDPRRWTRTTSPVASPDVAAHRPTGSRGPIGRARWTSARRGVPPPVHPKEGAGGETPRWRSYGRPSVRVGRRAMSRLPSLQRAHGPIGREPVVRRGIDCRAGHAAGWSVYDNPVSRPLSLGATVGARCRPSAARQVQSGRIAAILKFLGSRPCGQSDNSAFRD